MRLPPTSTLTATLFPYTTLFRSYRLGCDRGGGGARAYPHLHAPSRGSGQRRAAAPDDDGAGAQRPQYRDRRQLRRRAGDGEAVVRRRGGARRADAGGGEQTQLGAAAGARKSVVEGKSGSERVYIGG